MRIPSIGDVKVSGFDMVVLISSRFVWFSAPKPELEPSVNVPWQGFGLVEAGPKSDCRAQWSCQAGRAEQPLFATVVLRQDVGRTSMEKSVGQARWLLAPVFAIAITFMVAGIVLS